MNCLRHRMLRSSIRSDAHNRPQEHLRSRKKTSWLTIVTPACKLNVLKTLWRPLVLRTRNYLPRSKMVKRTLAEHHMPSQSISKRKKTMSKRSWPSRDISTTSQDNLKMPRSKPNSSAVKESRSTRSCILSRALPTIKRQTRPSCKERSLASRTRKFPCSNAFNHLSKTMTTWGAKSLSSKIASKSWSRS